jgi:antitoxin CcdA
VLCIIHAHLCCALFQPESITMPGSSATVLRPAKAKRTSAKRPTNLSLSAEVLDAAKALGINVSQACDRHLSELVRAEQMRRWQAEHADFMSAYNSTVLDVDLPLEAWRTF